MAELRDLRVLLLEAYDQLEKDVGREIDIALQRQNRHHANLEAKVSAQDEALRQEHKRFTSMDRALSEAQDELAEASRRNAEYETGVYGLSEAMRDLKALRLQVRAADDQVRDAVETSNELGRKVEDLTEETRFLRQKAGIPEDADIDLGAFKIRSKVEAAQLRALNAQLEREVHELEEDRRRLRNELRYRAKWQGEHAAKLGLSARQLAMLEEFADALRFGQETNFVVEGGAAEGDAFSAQRAVDNVNARAVNELEEANRHLQERLAEALERARRSGVELDAPRAEARAPTRRSRAEQDPTRRTRRRRRRRRRSSSSSGRSSRRRRRSSSSSSRRSSRSSRRSSSSSSWRSSSGRWSRLRSAGAGARPGPRGGGGGDARAFAAGCRLQQQQLQQQYQQQFEQQQAQWQASAPQTVIERVVEPDPQSAAQIAELQRQLQRARAEIVRLEDGYHDAMMRSSQNYPRRPTRRRRRRRRWPPRRKPPRLRDVAGVCGRARPRVHLHRDVKRGRPRRWCLLCRTPSSATRTACSPRRASGCRRGTRRLPGPRRMLEAARRAAEDVEASARRAELESRDAAAAESNAAAVAATASALAEAQRVAAAAAAAAEATASQFEQALARARTRLARWRLKKRRRRAPRSARRRRRCAAPRRRRARRRATPRRRRRWRRRRAEEEARHARDQARSRAEDERPSRSAASPRLRRRLSAAPSGAARALAEAQRAATGGDARGEVRRAAA